METLVVVNFFPAFTPPSSGGEMRVGSLYRALSKDYNIVLLTSTDFGARFEEIVHTPRLRELRFPKDDLWRTSYSTLERSGVQGDLAGLAFALAVSDPACELRIQARRLASTASAIIHEFPFSEPIFADGCPCREFYNSHNFETSLFSSIVRGPGIENSLLKLMRLERNLVKRVEKVFATSESDAEKFRLFFGADSKKIEICPNGFDDVELSPIVKKRLHRQKAANQKPQLLFIGSAHQPNVEAAHFLLRLSRDLPEFEFLLAGGLCGALSSTPSPPNVKLLGPVDPEAKLRLLSQVDVFLNPVVLGSGTSLKALEALGSGVPMVSTLEGVRGLGLTPGIHCEIVLRNDFPAAIRGLLNDPIRSQTICAAGRTKVCNEYSWDRIAGILSHCLTHKIALKETSKRPLILALNDYPALQPGSGGIARIRNLLMHLDADVILVSFGSTCEIAIISANVAHVTIPKTAAHLAYESAINDDQPMSVNDGIAALFVATNRILVEVVTSIAQRANALIFEHPYMFPVIDAIDSVTTVLPIIYSAHNVESTHKAGILRGHSIGSTLTSFISELERRLVARAALIVCCTEADVAHFQAAGVKSISVPNGCTIPAEDALSQAIKSRTSESQKKIGFMGSSHGPNVEAADFIISQLAPALPEVQFELVGSVCTAIKAGEGANIVLHGIVSESEKTKVLATWDVALNPVESGGGSSLKLSDYLSHSLVTINTATGARGFAIEEREAGLVVERHRFQDALLHILQDHPLRLRMRANARSYATEKLSWSAITTQYRNYIHSLCHFPSSTAAPRLLVVTYRYTEPSLGGAEEYLIEVLKRLRPRFGTIDLAAIDVDHITNQHHFSCTLSVPNGGAAHRIGELFDQAHYFKPDVLPEDEVIEHARNLERAWSREERRLYSLFAGHLTDTRKLQLFGGFFWPENHAGVIRRWTSPAFSFLLPERACSFQISGYASVEKVLRLSLIKISELGESETIATYQNEIKPHFSLSVSLPPSANPGQHLLLNCEVDEHHALGDHRPFGILLESASVLVDSAAAFGDASPRISLLEVSTADLNEQIDEYLRTEQFEGWVKALRQIAGERDEVMNDHFAQVRGPHSKSMQNWIATHAINYDCVFVQGIPFDVIPATIETIANLTPRPRLVNLPHFHGDDRFYHWQRYYHSFAAADSTLLFSSSIKGQLEDGIQFDIVPGGGVRADEHGDPSAKSAFESEYLSNSPFFLCLGRKTASKGYEQVIRAHQNLRRSGVAIDLVLIGPDEDGREVTGDGLHYLGRQPREVIRGALSSCIGLITMSKSESFGIVLCEAWLFGKPVIANKSCYSFRELITDGVSGLLVSTDQELVEAMRHLVSNPQVQQAMGRAGFQVALKNFTWENVAATCFEALRPTCDLLPPAGEISDISHQKELQKTIGEPIILKTNYSELFSGSEQT